jgi:anhydro-N-acetylmuramic acid kinase
MIDNDNKQLISVLGLMSGTSCDGIDIGLIKTDGLKTIEVGQAMTIPYSAAFRSKLKAVIDGDYKEIIMVEDELTRLHANAIDMWLENFKVSSKSIQVIGFHGHTIKHLPDQGMTYQIGNIPLLCALTKISVIGDFRRKDVALGGQGAPLVPVFLRGISSPLPKPILFLNIGGVSNICYIDEKDIIAFDIGPGNAPMDDLVFQKSGKLFDENGDIARTGKANMKLVDEFMKHEFFQKKPPKSHDRNEFDFSFIQNLSLPDALATIAEIISTSMLQSLTYLPQMPEQIYIYGGGASNNFLVERIAQVTSLKVVNTDTLNINANFLEAYAFAYLAVRCMFKLPITYPSTTGVPQPQSGGVFCLA